MVFFNIKHLFISAFAVATLIGCGDSEDEPTPTPPVVEPVDDVVFFDDFDSFNSAYWSKRHTKPDGQIKSYNPIVPVRSKSARTKVRLY